MAQITDSPSILSQWWLPSKTRKREFVDAQLYLIVSNSLAMARFMWHENIVRRIALLDKPAVTPGAPTPEPPHESKPLRLQQVSKRPVRGIGVRPDNPCTTVNQFAEPQFACDVNGRTPKSRSIQNHFDSVIRTGSHRSAP